MVYPPTMDAINQRVMLHRYAIMHNGVNQGVEPALIASVIHQESQGKADVVTYEANVADYSYGLMQIRWMTAQWLAFTGDKSRLLDPEVNIDYGTRYLRYQLTRYSERTADAVAAYNAGRVILTGKGKYANAEYVDGVISQIRKYREILRWYFPGYDFSVRICLDV
jgi:soluble lytic murein transglycosylase-like protein